MLYLKTITSPLRHMFVCVNVTVTWCTFSVCLLTYYLTVTCHVQVHHCNKTNVSSIYTPKQIFTKILKYLQQYIWLETAASVHIQ